MTEQTKARLYAILDRQASTAPAALQGMGGAEVPFAVAFERVREEVILPALREFAGVLESRGRICELMEEVHPGHHPDLATIGLRLFPTAARIVPVGDYPALTFCPDPLRGKVQLTASNLLARPGGQDVRRVEYDLAQVTSAVVEEEFLKLVDDVFRA